MCQGKLTHQAPIERSAPANEGWRALQKRKRGAGRVGVQMNTMAVVLEEPERISISQLELAPAGDNGAGPQAGTDD
jgi:hypothetical protein